MVAELYVVYLLNILDLQEIKMKKLIKVVVTVLSLMTAGLPAFAKDSFSFSGLWKCDSSRAGGAMEIGFPDIVDNGKYFLRENIEIGGAGLFEKDEASGVTMLNNKLSLGGIYRTGNLKIKSYGFWITGANLIFSGKDRFSMETGFDFGGGGGFELGFEEIKSAFIIEYGGGWCFIPNNFWGQKQVTENFGYNSLTLGFRQYF